MASLTSSGLSVIIETPIYSSIPSTMKSTVFEAAKYVRMAYSAVSTESI